MRDPAGRSVRLHSGLTRAQVRALEQTVIAAHGTTVQRGRPDERAVLRFLRTLIGERPRERRLRAPVAPALSRAVARMVLDGVIELRVASGFVSGAGAVGEIFNTPKRVRARTLADSAARLGRDALEGASVVAHRGHEVLASHIYMQGRGAVTPAQSRALPTPSHVLRFLGIDGDSKLARRLREDWSLMELPSAPDEWISWRTRHGRVQRTQGLTWKLYVCPTRAVFRSVFEASAECLAEHGAFQFKIGSGAFALARPDKFVAYFHRRPDLARCMDALEPLLSRYDAQPVPFGAGATPSGMLAWGVDFAPQPSDKEEVSWRWWICERLARYLCHAEGAPSPGITSAEFALLRLSLDGVSLRTFAPTPRLLGEIARTSPTGRVTA